MKNEKNSSHVSIAGAVLFCLLSASCASTGISPDAADIIERNSSAAGQLERTIADLDRTVANSRERIAGIIKTSRGIEGAIERLEYLFTCYEQEIGRILREVSAVRDEAQAQGSAGGSGSSADSSIYTGAHHTDSIDD